MTPEQLREGAALLAAATPGPWTVDHEGQYITVRAGDTTPLMEMWANGRGKRRKDADAIAWLRTHAAELLADAGRCDELARELHRWNSAPGCVACMRKGTTELGNYCSVCGSRISSASGADEP